MYMLLVFRELQWNTGYVTHSTRFYSDALSSDCAASQVDDDDGCTHVLIFICAYSVPTPNSSSSSRLSVGRKSAGQFGRIIISFRLAFGCVYWLSMDANVTSDNNVLIAITEVLYIIRPNVIVADIYVRICARSSSLVTVVSPKKCKSEHEHYTKGVDFINIHAQTTCAISA